jgi:two-component sensor histidine kinase
MKTKKAVMEDAVIPEELNLKTTKSLGLHLVSILTEDQLKGKIEVERAKGTTFRIVFGIAIETK